MTVSCRCCGRVLKNPKWQALGIGPVCYAKAECNGLDAPYNGQYAALPFHPVHRDIVCRRVEVGTIQHDRYGDTLFNIPHRHKHHSPSGMEWGYHGSGPADFALNILALFTDMLPVMPETEYERLWDGTTVHPYVYGMHQEFKRDVIADVPREGGTIHGAIIRAWIITNVRKRYGHHDIRVTADQH